MLREVVFRIVVLAICVVVLRFEWVVYQRLRQVFWHYRWFAVLRPTFWTLALISKLPLLLALLLARNAPAFTVGWLEFAYIGTLAWTYTFFLLGVIYGLGSLMVPLWHWLRPPAPDMLPSSDTGQHSSAQPQVVGGITRGEFLKSAAALIPLGAHFSVYGGMIAGSREIITKQVRIAIRDLHEDLRGFRIVQISDLHVGPLISGRYLDLCAGILRQLGGNLLVVTGDIIDNNNGFIRHTGEFFRSVSNRFGGMFGILGNHDYIDEAEEIASKLPGSGLDILRNQTVRVRRGNGALSVIGLDYPGRRMGGERMTIARSFFRRTKVGLHPELPRIVLNHHPTDFLFLRNEPVDLVLSGHTHGGQIALSEDRDSILSPVSRFFPYYRGLYQENGHQLYVNAGTGHWMPLRINTPPEITVIELERA